MLEFVRESAVSRADRNGGGGTEANRSFAVRRLDDAEVRERLLSYCGIQAIRGTDREAKLVSRYRVLAWYPDPLRVQRLRPAIGAMWEEIDESDPLFRKAGRFAVRVVYALGLDAGEVELVQDGERLSVGRVRADVDEELPVRETILGAGRPLLGADPEFILARPNGQVVRASRYLPPKGEVGSDSMRIRGRLLWPIAELRPKPAVEPELLFKRLRRSLIAAKELVLDQDVQWLAGSMPKPGFSLGGHVHVSGLPITAELARVLDNYLALPLALVEESRGARRNRRPTYGFLGDVRRQPHGGFEYRTLPSWLVAPRYAKGTLAVLRVIADHHERLRLRPLDASDRVRAFYEGDKRALVGQAEQLWDDLARMPGAEAYRRLWTPMRDQTLSMRPWREEADFRPRWKL